MPEEQTKKLDKKVITLPCALTEEELLERGASVAELMLGVQKSQRQLDSASESHKFYKKSIEEGINSDTKRAQVISKEIEDKAEQRDVECEVLFNYDEDKVTITRLDTKEVVEERSMTADEHQELPIDGTTEDPEEEEEDQGIYGDEPETELDADGAEVEVPEDDFPWPEGSLGD